MKKENNQNKYLIEKISKIVFSFSAFIAVISLLLIIGFGSGYRW